ncbi:AAA domain-containing protein [Sphaerisporangium rufum]|nr:AAA domain-containing protein [Sphaerisporangium rufum]
MRFEVQGELGVAEGTPATLVVKGAPFEVEVVSMFGSVVTLSVPPDAPAATEATLRVDLSWLLIAQYRKLRDLASGGPGFDAGAAVAVVTPAGPDAPATRLGPFSTAPRGLNAGQRDAVALALTPGLTWLWGPPGTGKTTTISALVAELRRRGKRVLLAAPTNAALDVAVAAVLDRLPDVDEGQVVRLGQPADLSLVDRAGGRVLVDEIAAARGEPIARRRVEVGHALRENRRDLTRLKRSAKELTPAQEAARLTLETAIAESQDLQRALDRALLKVRRQVCREATVVAATPEAQEWLKRSPFEKAGIAAAVAGGRPPARLAALTEQYRMRPPIGHVVSTAFYPEGPLVTAPAVPARRVRSRAPWATGDLVVVDTSGLHARTARRQGMLSRYNLAHAQLIAAMVGGASDELHDLGLITPFAPQARLLESLLPEEPAGGRAASTVHRFQGGERDIVVYDTVDSAHGVTPLHPWFAQGGAGSEGARLLNVAASRARDNLVVIGSLDVLHRTKMTRDAVWTFFAHLLDRAEHLPWEKLLTLAAGPTELVGGGLVERLRQDLARAETVEMWLPRAPLRHLAPLLPALRSIRGKDAETEAVTLWVEPEPDGYLPAEALRARREGINVRPLTPIHESGAVIGDAVWSASAALLGTAPGLVLRTEHAALAGAVRRAQRRRPGGAPGTGQLGDDCGRCRRMLIRYEAGPRGGTDIRYACPACDRPPRATGGRRTVSAARR